MKFPAAFSWFPLRTETALPQTFPLGESWKQPQGHLTLVGGGRSQKEKKVGERFAKVSHKNNPQGCHNPGRSSGRAAHLKGLIRSSTALEARGLVGMRAFLEPCTSCHARALRGEAAAGPAGLDGGSALGMWPQERSTAATGDVMSVCHPTAGPGGRMALESPRPQPAFPSSQPRAVGSGRSMRACPCPLLLPSPLCWLQGRAQPQRGVAGLSPCPTRTRVALLQRDLPSCPIAGDIVG